MRIPDRPGATGTMGVLGLLGALLLLAGDMLLYAHAEPVVPVDPAFEATLGVRAAVLGARAAHLHLSGILAPLAAVLYLFGFRHVHLRLRGHAPVGAAFVALALSTMIVIGGAYHALWSHYGFILQHAATDPAGTGVLLDAATRFMRLMYGAGAVTGYSAALALLVLVVAKKSDYPRWTVVVNPGVVIALAPLVAPLAERWPAPAGAMLIGGWINLAFVVFFTVSLATMRRGPEATAEPVLVPLGAATEL